LVQGMQRSSPPGLFSAVDFERYRAAWSQPGAMTAMLNWYRAVAQRPQSWSPSPRVKPPMLIIWGTADTALEAEMAPLSLKLCDEGRLYMLQGISHWVQLEAAGEINRLLLEYLAA
jgi:epoxide hydrolase 4